MGLSLRDLNAQENDEATPVGQRLQPETAKLHVQANDPQEAQVALEKLEKMPGILNVAGIMCGMGQSSPWEHMNGWTTWRITGEFSVIGFWPIFQLLVKIVIFLATRWIRVHHLTPKNSEWSDHFQQEGNPMLYPRVAPRSCHPGSDFSASWLHRGIRGYHFLAWYSRPLFFPWMAPYDAPYA